MIEKEAARQAISTDPALLTMIGLLVAGTIGRILATGEPFDFRKFIGEIILSAVGAFVLYGYGLLQAMTSAEMLVLGGLGGLGGVRFLEWLIKIAKKVKDSIQ